jgi:5-methylcytosine-specific restriction endonuclease McrA
MAYKDPERQRAYAREWMRRNPEKAREAMRRWRDAHRELSRQRNRDYKRALYARDPEGQKARIAAYYAQHPDALRAKDHRYRARRRQADGHFTAAEWMDLVKQFAAVCGYCAGPGPLQADHRVPLCRGGTNFIDNIIPACARCNQRKGGDTEAEYRHRLAEEQILRPPEL